MSHGTAVSPPASLCTVLLRNRRRAGGADPGKGLPAAPRLSPLGAEVQGALLDVPEHREAVPQLRPRHPAGYLADEHDSPLLLRAGGTVP